MKGDREGASCGEKSGITMDSWARHLKIAAFVGLLSGFLIQFPIDVITKFGLIPKFGLDLVAVYQGLMVSGILFAALFILFAILLKGISTLLKRDYGEYLECIYYLVSLSIVSTYYLIATFNFFFRKYLVFHINLLANLSRFELFFPSVCILAAAIGMTLFALVKKKDALLSVFEGSRVILFLRKKIFKEMVFMLIFLICAALAADAYFYFGDTGQSGLQEPLLGSMPNVLLIVVDAMRGDSMGFVGYPRNITPFLDGIANKSVVFENAITPTTASMSTHASLFTGKHAGEHSMFLRHRLLETDGKTLAEAMGEKGYTSAGFISAAVLDKRSGLDRGFSLYESRYSFFELKVYSEFDVLYALKNSPILGSNVFQHFGEMTSVDVNKRAIPWVDKNKDAPFFLFIHYFDPHTPYIPDTRIVQRLSSEGTGFFPPEGSTSGVDSTALAQRITDKRLLYDAEILQADRSIEQLITHMDDLDLLNNTVIIILADHGEEFYEHGGFYHGSTLYDEALHVPFIIYYPEKFAPQRIKERVSTLDFFSTVLDLAGIEPPDGVDSNSLIPFIEGTAPYNGSAYGPVIAETIKTTTPDGSDATDYLVAIYSEIWKLILAKENEGNVGNALYNLEDDPREKNNLYDVEVEKREELKSSLFRSYKKSKAYLDSFPNLGDKDT